MANKTQKNVFKLAVLACCWLAFSSVSLAAEYYVSTTGDDTREAAQSPAPTGASNMCSTMWWSRGIRLL